MKTIVILVVACEIWGAAWAKTSFRVIKKTCDHVYGTPLGVFTESNFIQCSRICADYQNDACNSIMYNPVTKVCMLNQGAQFNEDDFPDDCGFMYAVRMIRKLLCNGEDWMFRGDRCYQYLDVRLSYNECVLECPNHGKGAILSIVHNRSALSDIYAVVQATRNKGTSYTYSPWVGIHDLVQEGVYMDLNNNPVDPSLSGYITSNHDTEDCGYASSSYIYISRCTYEWNCMCEMEASYRLVEFGSL